MENPIYPINLVGGQWNKVLSAYTGTGTIDKKTENCDYYQTYRIANEDAPTLFDEGTPIFLNTYTEEFGSDSSIDIYVWSTKDAVIRLNR